VFRYRPILVPIALGLLLAACDSKDFDSKGLSTTFKGNIDWVRDSFGQPVARIVKDTPDGPFPAIPGDPRPVPRSLKQQTTLIAELSADHKQAMATQASLAAGDPTRSLPPAGASAEPAPIAVLVEEVSLPVGVRDFESFVAHADISLFSLASIDLAEGSARLPDGLESTLQDAVALLGPATTARVEGYSAGHRLVMPGRGPHETNRWLADLRARRVAAAMVAAGAPPQQLLVGPAPEASRGSADKVEIIIDY